MTTDDNDDRRQRAKQYWPIRWATSQLVAVKTRETPVMPCSVLPRTAAGNGFANNSTYSFSFASTSSPRKIIDTAPCGRQAAGSQFTFNPHSTTHGTGNQLRKAARWKGRCTLYARYIFTLTRSTTVIHGKRLVGSRKSHFTTFLCHSRRRTLKDNTGRCRPSLSGVAKFHDTSSNTHEPRTYINT